MVQHKEVPGTPVSTHEDRILSVLREYGPMNRAEIGRRLGISRATVSEVVGALRARGAVDVKVRRTKGKLDRGRPPESIAIEPSAAYVMGVEFSHRVISVVVANAAHEIVAKTATHHGPGLGWPQRRDLAFSLIDSLAEDSLVHLDLLRGVGIAVSGPTGTNARTGPLDDRRAPLRLPDGNWTSEEAIVEAFTSRFRTPVLVETDTILATLAEAIQRSGDEPTDMIYVRVTEGIGGGIVLSGRLHPGPDGSAGDLGHVTVDPHGPICPSCGKRGCLETLASARAVVRDCHSLRPEIQTLNDVHDWLNAGDEAVRLVVRRAGRMLGLVLAGAATLLNPRVIVVGGNLTDVGPTYLAAVRHAFVGNMSRNGSRDVAIEKARLGEEGAALGAIAAVFHRSPLLATYPELDLADARVTAPALVGVSG